MNLLAHAPLFLITALVISGCLQQPDATCLGSDECPPSTQCRAGRCVGPPGDPQSPLTPPASDAALTTNPDASDLSPDPTQPDADKTPAPTPSNPCIGGVSPSPGDLRINEVLANPPPGPDGDANGDGQRDAFEDEFIEIVNLKGAMLDLRDTTLSVDGREVASLHGICLPRAHGIVVFGGYRGAGMPDLADDVTVLLPGARLGLANGGATISIIGPDGKKLDEMLYRDAPPESLTRLPQLDGDSFAPHSSMTPTFLMTPGRCADQHALSTGCPPPTPPSDPPPDDDTPAPSTADAG